MGRLFTFNSLVTPSIVKFLFYFGIAASIIAALGIIGTGVNMMNYSAGLGFLYIIGGILLIFVGIVVSRVWAELVLIQFMIRDELAWQRENRQGAP